MALQLALFPLSQMVLPGGRMRLRIFEPRYQRLVREAAAAKRPFASALLNPYVAAQHPDRICSVATLVNIIDFSQLEDGLLGITIEGESRVQIVERWQEDDQLHVANVELLDDWPRIAFAEHYAPIDQALEQVYQDNPELASLYQDQAPITDAAVLAKRWLEILTIPAPLKQQLHSAPSAEPALAVLAQWLTEQAPTAN
jgi:Lon protease-like protein